MSLKRKQVSSYKDFVHFDELYTKHQKLKGLYLELYELKFSAIDKIINEVEEKSKICDQNSEKIIQSLRKEVKRWSGDREFTSKELSEKLNEKTKTLGETITELEKCQEEINQQKKRVIEKNNELQAALTKIRTIKNEMESRHKGEMQILENHMVNQIKRMKIELHSSKQKAEGITEEMDQNAKTFRGILAENESKWTQEKVEMQQKIKVILEEVAHWNREALKMENRVRQYEKKLMAAGITLDYDREETKEREDQFNSLINERNHLKEQLDKAMELCKQSKKDQRETKSKNDENESIDQIDLKNQLDCFALMTGTKVTAKDCPKGKSLPVYICRSVDYSNSKMIEFQMEFLLDSQRVNYTILRLVGEFKSSPVETGKTEHLKINELPLKIAEILSLVNASGSK